MRPGAQRGQPCRAALPPPWLLPPAPPPSPTLNGACTCRDILAIPETRADWWQLYARHLKPRVDGGSLKLALVNSDRLRGTDS